MQRSWYVFSRTTKFIKYTLFGVLSIKAAHDGYEGYKLSSMPSSYEYAASKMKFTTREEQEALLKALSFAGYFKPESLWSDIVHMNFKDPEVVFSSVMKSVAKASNGGQINTHILRKNLFNELSEADAMDFILYLGQNAFVERQTIVTQREVDKALKESGISDVHIKIDGTGFANKGVQVATIHSELGALICERYKDTKVESKRDINDLLFSSRSHEVVTEAMPAIPQSGYEDGLVGVFHYLFDLWS